MNVRDQILAVFNETCATRGVTPPEVVTDDMVLLQSGLDSLGFAIFVTSLEMELGYDPFTMMDQPIYPQTFGELVEIYERFKDKA